ncbi:MAG: hypothetical protein KDG55_12100 [Rhodocyclaceae bacterium]|nr:hypothetical protein [Rhodocyclaceae bacterium]
MAGKDAIEQKFRQAVAAHGAGRADEAMAGYRAVLARDPKHVFARHYLGVACHQAGRLNEALPLLESSTARLMDNAGCRLNLANLYKDLGRRAQAEQHYLAAARLDPGLALVGFNLGQLRESTGDLAGATEAYRSAIQLPQAAARLAVLSVDVDPQAATALAPAATEAALLGELLALCAHAGDGPRAERVIARLSALGDDVPLTEAGATLARSGHLALARLSLEAALALNPAASRPRAALVTVLNDLGCFGEARGHAALGLANDGSDVRLWVGAADADKELGDLAAAVGGIERAVALAPERLDILSSLQQLRLCLPGGDPAGDLVAARAYGEAVTRHAPRPAALPSAAPPRAPGGRLRVGLLSGELAWTPIGRFLAGFIEHYPRDRLELWLFSDRAAAPDALAQRLHKRAHRVVDCAGWADARLAEAIHAARLDVLLELTGHAGANRLPMLSWRLAPRQGSFLGYAGTTGAPGIDFRIADAITEPEGSEAHSSERLLRLPGSYFCFDPACPLPEVAAAPMGERGHATFGCFVQRPKVSDPALAAWSRVLEGLPGSRFQLRCRSFTDPAAVARTADKIAALGGDPARFDLLPWGAQGDFLAHYGGIDIALNTYPFHQATNLCDALWMGVPTLSLTGERHCSRMADSLCRAAGLEGWCLPSEDAWVEAALALASDRQRLAALRAGLRATVCASALADGKGFAARLTEALRGL